MRKERVVSLKRETRETNVEIKINVDGTGEFDINTGIGFFNHLLESLAKHSLFDIVIDGSGDINVDYHHLVEDTGIVFGNALKEVLGDKKGINRFGFATVPLDEALVEVDLDISGRPYYVSNFSEFKGRAGSFDTELADVFFSGFSSTGYTLHILIKRGENSHHIMEAAFKAFGQSLRMAVAINERIIDKIPSTKGLIEK